MRSHTPVAATSGPLIARADLKATVRRYGCATLAAALAADYLFVPPLFSLYVHDPHDAIWLALYAIDCGVAILLIRALTRAKTSSEQARRSLQAEIAAHLAADADRDRLLPVRNSRAAPAAPSRTAKGTGWLQQGRDAGCALVAPAPSPCARNRNDCTMRN